MTTYTARDGRHDSVTLRRFGLLRAEAAEPDPAVRAQLRARSLGTTAAQLAQRHQRRAQLAADAEAAGLRPVHDQPDDPDVASLKITVALPPETRSPWLVCAMCARTMHKRKGGRVEVRPDTLACPCCAGLPQTCPPAVLDMWLADYPNYKRHAVAATYRVDPARLTAAADISAEVTELFSDVDGAPLAVQTRQVPAAAVLVPVATFFSWVAKRGRGVL